MPCYTVKTTEVNIGAMNLPILVTGLQAAGYSVRSEEARLIFSAAGSYEYHTYEGGKLLVTGSNAEAVANSVKRAYAAECIRRTVGREWRAKEIQGDKEISFTITSRR